jgi:hypothetical protein
MLSYSVEEAISCEMEDALFSLEVLEQKPRTNIEYSVKIWQS